MTRSTMGRGARPRRKPGTSTWPARRRYASSIARSTRSCSTSIASETCRGGSSVLSTFTREALLAATANSRGAAPSTTGILGARSYALHEALEVDQHALVRCLAREARAVLGGDMKGHAPSVHVGDLGRQGDGVADGRRLEVANVD